MRVIARINPRRPRRRLMPVAMAAVTLLSLAVGVPAAAAAPSTVVGVASGRCLDVVGNARTPGTGINIYDCNGQANQAWTLTSSGELRVYDETMCLDMVGQDTTAPAALQINNCNGAPTNAGGSPPRGPSSASSPACVWT
ncbi:RICIN domain-containing protein [Micromonospora sp. M12]